MKRLAIIGSGDLGQQIAYHAQTDGHYDVVAFFDDFQTPGTLRHGIPVAGGVEQVLEHYRDGKFDALMIGIGYKHIGLRQTLYDRFSTDIPFGSVIHTSSYVDKSCTLGSGVMIYPGCMLDMNVVIGDNVLLNIGCVIAHDTTIGTGSFLSPAVKVAGFVDVGPSVILGIGTTVIDNVAIVSGVRTGGGAVVTADLESPGLYVGIPAKFIKHL